MARLGHVFLHPVLYGVLGVVQRGVGRVLGPKVMGETMVEAVTQGSIRVRDLRRVWSGGRRKRPICGKDLEAPGMKFENCFIDNPEL